MPPAPRDLLRLELGLGCPESRVPVNRRAGAAVPADGGPLSAAPPERYVGGGHVTGHLAHQVGWPLHLPPPPPLPRGLPRRLACCACLLRHPSSVGPQPASAGPRWLSVRWSCWTVQNVRGTFFSQTQYLGSPQPLRPRPSFRSPLHAIHQLQHPFQLVLRLSRCRLHRG